MQLSLILFDFLTIINACCICELDTATSTNFLIDLLTECVTLQCD